MMHSMIQKNNIIKNENNDSITNENGVNEVSINSQNKNYEINALKFNNNVNLNIINKNQYEDSLKMLIKQRFDFENSLKYEWEIVMDDINNSSINSLKLDIEDFDQKIKIRSNNYSEIIKTRNNLLTNLQNIIIKSNEEYESYDIKINEIKNSINELNTNQQELEIKINKLNIINENSNNQENIDNNSPKEILSPDSKITNLKKLDQLQNMFLNNNRQIFKLNKTRITYLEIQDNIERDLFAKTLELRQNQTKIEKEIAKYRTEIYYTIFLHIKFELSLYNKIDNILTDINNTNEYNNYNIELTNYLNLLNYSIKTRRIIELNFVELFKKELQITSFSNLSKQKENILIQINNLQKNYEDTQNEYSTFSQELVPQKENYNYQKELIENKLKELLKKINDLEKEYHPIGNDKSLSEEEEYLLSLKFQPLEQDVLAYMEKQKLYECEIKRLDRVEEKYNYRSMTLKEELISTKIKLQVIKNFEQIIQINIINNRNNLDDKCLNFIEKLITNYDVNLSNDITTINKIDNNNINSNINTNINTNTNNNTNNNNVDNDNDNNNNNDDDDDNDNDDNDNDNDNNNNNND
eukprot:jgi/Orpsp1_1/1190759/evm.model.d7180000081049.1